MGEMLNTKHCGLNEILERKINRTSYIVGGRTAGPGVWPWACSVGFIGQGGWEHFCGGTLGGFHNFKVEGMLLNSILILDCQKVKFQ